jgi:hypothetical protein
MNPLNYLSHRLGIRSLVVVGAGCLLLQSAHASLLFSEGFNYTSGGNLGGNLNPGGNAWGSGNNALTIASGNLTYPGLQDLGGNELSVAWGPPNSAGSIINTFANVTSGTIFYSFLLDTTTAPTGGNSYLTSLNPGTSAPNGGSDALTIYIGSTSTAGSYRLGVRTGSSSQTYLTGLSVGNTYLVVAEYDFGAGMASLFLDPTPGASMPAADMTATPASGKAPTSIDDVGFKVVSGFSAGYLVDNLLIGTTWGDVTPTPEPSSLVLAGMGALGLAIARRMRR